MVVLTACSACQKEEGLNIVGEMADSLSSQELTTLVKNCIFRCDPCFQDRIALMEEAAKENAAQAQQASKPKKPPVLVKRSG